MSLEIHSQKLKDIVATYDTQWFLGDLAFLMSAGKDRAEDQLGMLSSPLRQLYYLAGLNISSESSHGIDSHFSHEKWSQIAYLLNEIEKDYEKMFFPNHEDELTEDWHNIIRIAMPSFLAYFNQGPLNYEEQVINWIRDLYSPLNQLINSTMDLQVEDFIQFYQNLDNLHQTNFQAHSTRPELLRPNWKEYSQIDLLVPDDMPLELRSFGEQNRHLHIFTADHGIIDRFFPVEIESDKLTFEKVKAILDLLSTSRTQSPFLYYTETNPGNPLYEKPIVNLGNGLFQVFEVKQVIHAIEYLLERICKTTEEGTTKYIELKGALLESRIIEIFSNLFKTDFRYFQGYYVDGMEQDILFLWKNFAFIIEAKGYSIREPLRNPEKAFVRIKDDFNKSIGYGYTQTRRVENKFINGEPLRITNKNGNLIEEIDTNKYKEDFSIIVNLNSFGQIQCDLSQMLNLENDDDLFPWVIKLDDLEVFILTLIAQKRKPIDFVYFLLMRETLHGKLICSDELSICGGFLTNKLTNKNTKKFGIVNPPPEFSSVFDKQYKTGMGFKNEKLLAEKLSGKYVFW